MTSHIFSIDFNHGISFWKRELFLEIYYNYRNLLRQGPQGYIMALQVYISRSTGTRLEKTRLF
jgi:hypothetical protein